MDHPARDADGRAWTVVGYGKGHFTLQLGNHIITRLRNDLFGHFQKLSLQFYAKERTGGIVWRLVSEVNGVANIIYAGMLLLVFDIAQLAFAIYLLLWLNWKLAMAVLVLLPFYGWTLYKMSPAVRSASDAVSRHMGQVSGNVQEQFAAMSLVKTYAAEDRETARFQTENQKQLKFVLHQSHLGHAMGALSDGVIHLGTTIVICFGGFLALHNPKTFSGGQLTAFLGYVGIMYGPVKRFADLNLVYQNSWASVRRVFRVFDIRPKIVDKAEADDAGAAAGRGGLRPTSASGTPTTATRAASASTRTSRATRRTRAVKGARTASGSWRPPRGSSATSTSASSPASGSPWSALRDRARRRWRRCCPGCTTSRRGRSRSTGSTSATTPSRPCGRRSASSSRRPSCSAARSATTSSTASPTPPTKMSLPPPGPPTPTPSSPAWPRATTPPSASAAPTCPAANANASASPARS